ncbi:hypothetical protein Taro_003854 [Colocasia esculenta]|uniref:Uncharacterized protein n=1 Tax=Colocasia esculenta TaxID=4460 RepID=A0A843TIG1_COLES|nr:hypothetical protein [Colocasia esculenta]
MWERVSPSSFRWSEGWIALFGIGVCLFSTAGSWRAKRQGLLTLNSSGKKLTAGALAVNLFSGGSRRRVLVVYFTLDVKLCYRLRSVSEDAECDSVLCVLLVVVLSRSPWSPFSTARWLTGARGKTLVREAELDRVENSGSGGDSREKASRGSTRIEVWQDFFHASEVVRGRLSRFEELCLSVVGLVLLFYGFLNNPVSKIEIPGPQSNVWSDSCQSQA